jgi:putative transcriptional regulator
MRRDGGMSDDSLAACMDRIERPVTGHGAPPDEAGGYLPGALGRLCGWWGQQGEVAQSGHGREAGDLPTGKDASARLLYIPGGQAVPDHGHRGLELTLVLQGAFRDETDRFGPGDIEIADEAMQHTPVAEEGEVCICLAATDAPLKFNAIIPRLAQPFLRI